MTSSPRFLLFGGKGGVGKTTLAAAWSLRSAVAGSRVLVVSTDPAHSLGDAFGLKLTATPRSVALPRVRRRGAGFLHAVELDASRAFGRWLNLHRDALADVIEHGTWLDRDDADALLELSIPGVDELMGLLEIVRWAEPRKRMPAAGPSYDLVVVDAAPTGHTLRLLAAPVAVKAVASVLDALQESHRFIRRRIAGRVEPEKADRLITAIAEQSDRAGALLGDPARTAMHWVTLAEPMSLVESVEAVGQVTNGGVSVPEIIVNRLVPSGAACPVCDRRRADERRTLIDIRRHLGGRGRVIRVVPSDPKEPRGIRPLLRMGRLMDRVLDAKLEATSVLLPRVSRSPTLAAPEARRATAPESIASFHDARLIFFGGKGGVGKTTAAAAAAVRMARAAPRRTVLLLSTDPAHSLGDVFGMTIGDRFVRIPHAPPNLRARELDASAALAAKRDVLRSALDEIGSAFGPSGHSGVVGGGAEPLVELAPPGIDELLGMLSIAELLSPGDERTIIVDTAPTGHALRLLEMPEVAREWAQVLMRVLLKYRSLAPPGHLASELVGVSRSIRALQTLVRDARRTAFIIVTRAAELPRLETERLRTRLRTLALRVPAILVNALTFDPRRCPRCRAAAAAERASLERLLRSGRPRSRDCVIIQAPLTAPPPRGARALDRWGQTWIS